MEKTSFYSEEELNALGLKSFGKNVLISRFCRIYGTEKISVGDNVRIDDFCILSGEIHFGSNIHIASYVGLFGQCGIDIEDYCGVSSRTVIYSATDDYSGDFLVGPVNPKETLHIIGGAVHLKKYVTIGTGCTIMPGVTIAEGSVTGSMTLVNKSLDEWGVYVGVPARRSKDRNKGLLRFVEK